MSLSTYQVHPAILLVSLALQVEPIVPHQQANPWILPRFQNLLQKYLKFLVWNEVYEQFVVFLFKRGKDTTVSSLHEKFKVQNQQNLLLGRGVLRKRGHFTRASQSPEPSQSVCSEKYNTLGSIGATLGLQHHTSTKSRCTLVTMQNSTLEISTYHPNSRDSIYKSDMKHPAIGYFKP